MPRHDLLLLDAAVVLQREDDRVFGSLEAKDRKALTECWRKGRWMFAGRACTWKAYSLMAWMTSLKRICEVRV